jgi:2-isopropylmalate synthase
MTHVSVFDTTLRDGEQAPGSAITIDNKIEIARQLWRLNVDVIEAGFPVASTADFEAVKQISDELKDVTICAFSRAMERDIRVAAEALNGNKNGRIQIVSPVSDLHLKTRLNKNRKQGLELIKSSILMAKGISAEVAWIAEDSSRADPDYLLESFDMAVQSGAKIVTYADTVGYALPDEVNQSIRSIVKAVGLNDVIIGVHCHNDLGLAVANTLSAVLAGAREVQCTINGIGERAGNAALEEVVMALQVRNEKLNMNTNIDTRLLTLTSGLVSQYTKFPVPKNKPIVGENAFAHCSGMHQHGVLACPGNYEIMLPEFVGAKQREIIIGRHSGHHGVMHVLKEEGYDISQETLQVLMDKIKSEVTEDKYFSVEELINMKNDIDKFNHG